MAGNPRAVVLDILIEVLEHGGFSHQTIYRLLNEEGFTSKERAFAVRLARGTIENALLLDDCIDQVSKTPVRKMKPLVRNVLREAVYQIRFMDNVPDSAAVNEAVKLMRKRGLSQLSGFVNGVLRGYLRARDAGKEPQPRTDEARYSTPQWILDLWQESYPSEMKSILEGLNQKPDLTIAVNMRKISAEDLISRLREEGVEAELLETEQVEAERLEAGQFCTVTGQPGTKSEGAGERQKSSSLDKIRLNSSVDLERLPEFKEGLFYVQDLSSMLPAEAVMEMLDHYGVVLKGRKVTIFGRSLVIGKPVTLLLITENATVTVCHTKTADIKAECRAADIIVACCGVARMVTPDFVREGQIVIDVGMNVDSEGKLCGDVDYDAVEPIVDSISPVPGGVGSVTTSVLLKHVVDNCVKICGAE